MKPAGDISAPWRVPLLSGLALLAFVLATARAAIRGALRPAAKALRDG
ncbi:MAG: hypothetical protein KGL70_08885 [Betaproteobacteria bacterium]|nr:hypothetical protein [Betaproteobacteria bacterium]MDE2210133.1 hypothetical protein [Betaproteobacteria bacterium]MDE2359485.1 hypothetical protein [Betaproteobacteria bacterium]